VTVILPELEVWRWCCPLCSRWIGRDSIRSTDRIDPGEYYGIATTIVGVCSRCGEVTDPQLRPVVWQESASEGERFHDRIERECA
jgi:hypothetical protein